MQIWVDADACPVPIKEILFRAAERTKISLFLVANQPLRIPQSDFISFIQVESGFDVADNEIVKKVAAEDLVITSDIPLANDVIEKGAKALSPRGELFSENNIKARLSMRDFMDSMRSSGVELNESTPSFSQKDRLAFANQLDKVLNKYLAC